MNRAFLLLISLIVTSVVTPPISTWAQKTGMKPQKLLLHEGEQLNYDVSWSDFVVAADMKITTTTRNNTGGTDSMKITAQTQSVGVVKILGYKLNDTYDTYVDTTSLRPIRCERNTIHGKKALHTTVTIDAQKNIANYDDGISVNIPPGTFDLISFLYIIRNMDIKPGKRTYASLLEDKKIYKLSIEPEAREKVYTRVATYDAVRIAIKQADGSNIKDDFKARVFLTRDSRRLPVLLTADLSWGQVRMELTSYIPFAGEK